MNKKTAPNIVHIAHRGGGCQLWILVSQFRVLRTGTLSEIHPDNLQVTVMRNPRTGEKQLSFSANGQNGQ